MEVSNGVQGGPRHGDRVAAALADVVVEERHGPWSIISANTGESGHARENHRPRRPGLVEVLAPDPGRAAVASFKDDRRTARAAALYVQPAATPNVNEAREVTLCGVGHWRSGARGAEGRRRTVGRRRPGQRTLRFQLQISLGDGEDIGSAKVEEVNKLLESVSSERTEAQTAVAPRKGQRTATTSTADTPRRSPPRAVGCVRPLICSAS